MCWVKRASAASRSRRWRRACSPTVTCTASKGIRAPSKPWGFLKPEGVTDERIAKANKLNELAQARGQTLAQMSLAWVLRDSRVTTALIGASKVQQVEDCAAAINNLSFSDDELKRIDTILA